MSFYCREFVLKEKKMESEMYYCPCFVAGSLYSVALVRSVEWSVRLEAMTWWRGKCGTSASPCRRKLTGGEEIWRSGSPSVLGKKMITFVLGKRCLNISLFSSRCDKTYKKDLKRKQRKCQWNKLSIYFQGIVARFILHCDFTYTSSSLVALLIHQISNIPAHLCG